MLNLIVVKPYRGRIFFKLCNFVILESLSMSKFEKQREIILDDSSFVDPELI